MSDELSDGELRELKELMIDADSCGRLTQWEREFVESLDAKLTAHGKGTRISDKQHSVINRLKEKVYA